MDLENKCFGLGDSKVIFYT